MGNELCVASGGCPHKVEKKLSQNFILIKIPRWTFCWSTTPRSHLSWTLIKIAREIANARDGRWNIPRNKEGWQKRLFSDKVRQDRRGPRTSRRTSAVFERDFFSCGEGRDGGCALWEGGPGPLKVEIFLQPSLTCWGLQKKTRRYGCSYIGEGC